MSKIKVTQVGSIIGQMEPIRKTMRALGLRKMNASRVLPDNNCTRGMINKVKHLVTYELQK